MFHWIAVSPFRHWSVAGSITRNVPLLSKQPWITPSAPGTLGEGETARYDSQRQAGQARRRPPSGLDVM
jgi:hypothetical protein